MGDGSITEGEVSEAFHMAALKQFPILYLIQDNGWDISASGTEIRSNDIIDYVKGFGGIEIVEIEGDKFIQSYSSIQMVINTMREATCSAFNGSGGMPSSALSSTCFLYSFNTIYKVRY